MWPLVLTVLIAYMLFDFTLCVLCSCNELFPTEACDKTGGGGNFTKKKKKNRPFDT